MSNNIRYVPILKGRSGEFNALAEIADTTRSGIVPLVEIVPRGDAQSFPDVRSSAEHGTDQLGKSWGACTVLIDCGFLDTGSDAGDGGVVAIACRRAEQWKVAAIPVLRLDDPALARQDVAALHSEFDRGVCVRLAGDDLDEDGADIDDAVGVLLAECGLGQRQADLLIDAGPVGSDLSARAFARMIGGLIRDLVDLDGWRSITVSSGAFPADLSGYAPWAIAEHPRYDADMWAQLVSRRRIARVPGFGDYAIAHPLLPSAAPFAPAPQLRYTTADNWLTLRARKNDPTGNRQFYDICDAIANHPSFAGGELGSADARIEDSRKHGPGNATTWRQIGTTHHLDFVARRLTVLGEP